MSCRKTDINCNTIKASKLNAIIFLALLNACLLKIFVRYAVLDVVVIKHVLGGK